MLISFIFCAISFLVIVLFVGFSGTCVPEARAAVDMFLHTVLPSMFPFYVLSSIIVSTGVLSRICAPLRPATRLLFGLPPECGAVVVLGFICGFPMGAKITSDMYLRGDLTKKEAACLSAFTNNVGPVFMASIIGRLCFGSSLTGLIIWLATVAASVLSGIIICYFIIKRDLHTNVKKYASNRNAQIKHCAQVKQDKQGKNVRTEAGVREKACAEEQERKYKSKIDVPAAIMSSGNTILYVGAVIIFFSSLTALFKIIPGLSETARAILYSFFEITGGITRLIPSIPTSDYMIKYAITAAAAAWSGVSVHLQVCGILAAANIKIRYYIASKLIQTAFAPIITIIIFIFMA